MQEVKACFNLVDQTVSANLKIQPKFLKGGGTISGSFVAGEMGLRDIGILGENLMIPIGTTPAKLQKVGARVNDLHLNPGWFIDGELGISVGPAKIGDLWPVFVDSKATWHSNGYLQISAALQIIGIETGFGLIRYTPAESLFYAEAYMEMYMGAFKGEVQLTARPNFINGKFGMSVQIPPLIPVIGGIAFGGADVEATITDQYWEFAAGVWFQLVPDIPQYVRPPSMFGLTILPTSPLSWRGVKHSLAWRRSALLPECLYPCDLRSLFAGPSSTSDTTRKTASALDRMVAA